MHPIPAFFPKDGYCIEWWRSSERRQPVLLARNFNRSNDQSQRE
jgi:hypothetical protein